MQASIWTNEITRICIRQGDGHAWINIYFSGGDASMTIHCQSWADAKALGLTLHSTKLTARLDIDPD